MKLIFRGHDDRYAVEQSLLAFFPEERPVYKPAEEGEDHALVTLSRHQRQHRKQQRAHRRHHHHLPRLDGPWHLPDRREPAADGV